MGKEWSDEEVDLLKEIYPHYTNKELSNIFGRTYAKSLALVKKLIIINCMNMKGD